MPATDARLRLLMCVQPALWCAVAVLLLQPSFHVQDLALYYNASRSVLSGMIPYRDFPLEYPPLALVPMTLPRLLRLGASLQFRSYVWLFLAVNVVWVALLACCVVRLGRRWMPARDVTVALLAYGALAIIGSPILAWRFDLFPALLTAAAVLAVLENHPGLAGALVGLGGATKLYPLVLIPVFVAWYAAANNRRGAVRVVTATAIASATALLPFALVERADVFSFIRYHELRGLEIESAPAGLIMLAHSFGGLPAAVVENYGAMHLQSPAADAVQRWLPVLFIVASGVVTVAAFRRFRTARESSDVHAPVLVDFVLASLLVFMVTNKVFSPQYLAWILPFTPLLSGKRLVLAIALFVLTIAIFPYGFASLIEMRLGAVVLVNGRNVIAIGLAAWLIALPTVARSAESNREDAHR